jgi:hypothetical protein
MGGVVRKIGKFIKRTAEDITEPITKKQAQEKAAFAATNERKKQEAAQRREAATASRKRRYRRASLMNTANIRTGIGTSLTGNQSSDTFKHL